MFRYEVFTGSLVEVVGVGEDDLGRGALQVKRGEGSNRRLSSHGHENGGLDFPASELESSSSRVALLAFNYKWDRAGHWEQANLLATLGVLSMLLRAFLCVGLVCCSDGRSPEPDSSVPTAEPIWEHEFDTEAGRFHVVLSPNPDPPEVGPFELGMRISRNSDNPSLDGALLVNAGVHVFGEGQNGGGDIGGDIKAEELGAGEYQASWAFAHSGPWHLRLEIGAAEDMDIALIGLLVQD